MRRDRLAFGHGIDPWGRVTTGPERSALEAGMQTRADGKAEDGSEIARRVRMLQRLRIDVPYPELIARYQR